MGETDIVSRAESLAEQARGDSVKVSYLTNGEGSLTGTPRLNEPLISYLLEDEQPHHIYVATNVSISGADSAESSSGLLGGLMVVSDLRVLIVLEQEMTDDVISIPLNSIESVDYRKRILRGPILELHTSDREYKISSAKIDGQVLEEIEAEEGADESHVEELYQIGTPETDIVCKKCREKVSPSARKCPHCGYYPGKGGKGALWHGTALATSFSPVGWAMMLKGGADEVRTRRGVAEEVDVPSDPDGNEEGPRDDFEKLERLNELRAKGVLSEKEFEKKKEELIDEI